MVERKQTVLKEQIISTISIQGVSLSIVIITYILGTDLFTSQTNFQWLYTHLLVQKTLPVFLAVSNNCT